MNVSMSMENKSFLSEFLDTDEIKAKVDHLTGDELKQYLITVFAPLYDPDLFKKNLDFLVEYAEEIGFAPDDKLREFYYEALSFDLENGVQTCLFIPEEDYVSRSVSEPQTFASTDHVNQGVKHRPSLTSVIRKAFGKAIDLFKQYGVSPEDVTVFDLGCGVAKPSMIALLEFGFKKAVGIDYYKPILSIAQTNIDSLNFEGMGKAATLEFADVAEFSGYDDISVIYIYNPFGEEVLKTAIEKIEQNCKKAVVLYNKPLYAHLFDKEGWSVEYKHSENRVDYDTQLNVYSYGLK